MKLILTLSADERIALRRFALERDMDIDRAAGAALRDWLIGNGYLELEHELAEDTETAGEA